MGLFGRNPIISRGRSVLHDTENTKNKVLETDTDLEKGMTMCQVRENMLTLFHK